MKNEPEQLDTTDVNENARVEYAAANDAFIHYDNFAWQVGSVLFAGVFIFWGLVISSTPKLTILLLGNLLVCLLMSAWLLYAAHNRQIYRFKLHRIRELEEQLGMFQHRRFRDKKYNLDKPVGHCLDVAVYIILSFGVLLPGIIQTKHCEWWRLENVILFLLTFSIVVVVVWRVHLMGARVSKTINQ